MTEAAWPSGMACPACAAAPEAPATANRAGAPTAPLRRYEISLPAIHCAACITGVERGLAAEAGVAAARVNLTLKRVAVTAEDAPGTENRLIAALKSRGFEARPLDSAALEATRTDAVGRDLLARIGVAGFALMNVMLLSISVWAGAADSTRDLMHWISAAIAIPAIMFAAQPFFRNAWRALRAGRLDMDVPISTAILLALGVSLWETAQSGAHAFFDAALMLSFFLLIGRYLSHLTRASARSAAAELAALEVHMAERVAPDGTRETVPMDAVREGDVLVVPVGARVPADGSVTEGRSEIDASMLTGETMPEAVAPGSAVRAGMMNLSGPLLVRAEALGDETLLKQIARLVEAAEQSRSRYASLADRASQWYSHVVNVLAITAFFGWGLISGDWRLATNIAAAVLIITCPCALGLAVPAVLTAASGRLFRQGVLLKDGDAFERLAEIDAVVFDKTGTLTTGRPILTNGADIAPTALAVAAGLAEGSAHPLSRAVATAARAAGIHPSALTDIREHPGLGSEATHDGRPVRLGRAEWVGALTESGVTTSWLRIGDADPIALHFTDEIRPEATETVERLRAAGLPVTLLSGDGEAPVRALAERLGIETWIARATPPEKVAHIEAMRDAGRKPLMIGDGLNDAAALAAAHVSMSPASAVDASRSAADLILIGDRIDRAVDAWDLSRTARRRILENFGMAFAYNVVTVPIAYAGFVTPLIAAVAMSFSSIVVSLNAMRLGRRT
jgi:Cu2+-exporting ATPase